MKLTLILAFVFGCFAFSSSTLAETPLNKIIKTKEENKSSTSKKRRRKKVLMCNECGKPETECECDGHGDEEAGHDDHSDH